LLSDGAKQPDNVIVDLTRIGNVGARTTKQRRTQISQKNLKGRAANDRRLQCT
jgi:hypothetical protein